MCFVKNPMAIKVEDAQQMIAVTLKETERSYL